MYISVYLYVCVYITIEIDIDRDIDIDTDIDIDIDIDIGIGIDIDIDPFLLVSSRRESRSEINAIIISAGIAKRNQYYLDSFA